MSCIVDFAETSIGSTNIVSGFDIIGPESSENMTQDAASDETIAKGTIQDLMGSSSRFDFVKNGEAIENDESFGVENEAIVDEIDSKLAKAGDGGEILSKMSGKDVFALEFFNSDFDFNDQFTAEESEIAISGVSDNSDSPNDEISVTLSINGQELAQFEVSQDFGNEEYEIF